MNKDLILKGILAVLITAIAFLVITGCGRQEILTPVTRCGITLMVNESGDLASYVGPEFTQTRPTPDTVVYSNGTCSFETVNGILQ